MNIDEFSTRRLSQKIGEIAADVRRVLKQEKNAEYEAQLVEDSIRQCIANKLDTIEEGMLEMFTSPGRQEFAELAAILERRSSIARAEGVGEAAQLAVQFGDESVFDGYRVFSKPKLAAMMEYLTGKGHFVYRTSLNKLLFYSDLSYFYLRGRGISGAVYHNRPFGPVADPAEPILGELIREDRVKVLQRTKSLEAGAATDEAADVLTDEEKRLLDWVAATYGHMSASEISALSHTEMAYKFTEPNEPIAYAYAQFLKRLPPKNLLDQ